MGAAALLLGSLAACRTAPRRCTPERGTEAWTITRYPDSAAAPGMPAAIVSLRIRPLRRSPYTGDTATASRYPLVRISEVPASGGAQPIATGGMEADGRVGLPAAARSLRPGTWRIRVIEIGFAAAVREITLHAGERVELEVETRQAAVCLDRVVTVSAETNHRP